MSDDIDAQIDQAFDNVQAALQAAGVENGWEKVRWVDHVAALFGIDSLYSILSPTNLGVFPYNVSCSYFRHGYGGSHSEPQEILSRSSAPLDSNWSSRPRIWQDEGRNRRFCSRSREVGEQ